MHREGTSSAVDHGGMGKYLPTLDGWRAVAIVWVILRHNDVLTLGRFNDAWVHDTGDRGVQLFFALSGLLIYTRLLREETTYGGISLRSFYTRRVFRIQPAALFYLAVLVVLTWCGLIAQLWTAILGAVLMVRNVWPLRPPTWYAGHFWSLSVEEHFYLFLPGFLVLCRRHRLAIFAALTLLFELWRIYYLRIPREPDIYLRTDLVLGTILLGCVFAQGLSQARVFAFCARYLRAWVGLLYAACVFAGMAVHHSRVDHMLLISVFPVVMVATMLHPASLTGRLLEWAPMRFVGRISYSLYLWQQLFFDGSGEAGLNWLHSKVLLCWCLTFACAIASHYVIEKPFIRMGHKIAKRFDLQLKSEHAGG